MAAWVVAKARVAVQTGPRFRVHPEGDAIKI